MSYLSKIEIDYETAFRAGLRDSYSWHQKIWLAFPNQSEANRSFLTRIDEIDGGFRLLLLSSEAPVRPAWCPASGWNSKPFAPKFLEHRSYGFNLVANPTRKVRSNGAGVVSKNGRRLPLIKREELLGWIERKGTQFGFILPALEQIRTLPRPSQFFVKQGKAGQHTATEFHGTLQVMDPALFEQAALTGIGSAKAFGFGLLCLFPIE